MNSREAKNLLREMSRMLGYGTNMLVGDDRLQEFIEEEINNGFPNVRPTIDVIHFEVTKYGHGGAYTACGVGWGSTNHTSDVLGVTCRRCQRTKSYKEYLNNQRRSFEF